MQQVFINTTNIYEPLIYARHPKKYQKHEHEYHLSSQSVHSLVDNLFN